VKNDEFYPLTHKGGKSFGTNLTLEQEVVRPFRGWGAKGNEKWRKRLSFWRTECEEIPQVST